MPKVHAPHAQAISTAPAQTLFEKILARHLTAPKTQLNVGDSLWLKPDLRFIHDIYTAMCAHMLDAAFEGQPRLLDTHSILTFEDHYSYAAQSPSHVQAGLIPQVNELSRAHRAFVARFGLRDYGYLSPSPHNPKGEGSEGISHALMAEQHALPGMLIVGTDSHTPHSGALGCVAYGVGTSDMANAFVTQQVRLTVPESIKIELTGKLAAGITAKDVVLHLLAQAEIRAGAGVGKVFEFCGAVVRNFSIDERATLTNLVAELGGFTGLVAPDATTVAFIQTRRGVKIELEAWMHSDANAHYAQTIRLDCSALSPFVAAPGDPGNGLPLNSLKRAVKIDIAYAGSCTAGKREDFDYYHQVLNWAAQHKLKVADNVKLYLQFGTVAVRDYCAEQEYLKTFEQVGAILLQPACGACAQCGPGVSTDAKQVTVSAVNRNFAGRNGPGSVWLASPPTVVASAIAGEIISFADLQNRHKN